ncbi:hypothetical protein Btru_071888 [Bulinus truncatus]|nr:hypothetical protein Btru_071888 [Bulinus truncatus]
MKFVDLEYESQTKEYESQTKEYESQTKEYESQTKEYESQTMEYVAVICILQQDGGIVNRSEEQKVERAKRKPESKAQHLGIDATRQRPLIQTRHQLQSNGKSIVYVTFQISLLVFVCFI